MTKLLSSRKPAYLFYATGILAMVCTGVVG